LTGQGIGRPLDTEQITCILGNIVSVALKSQTVASTGEANVDGDDSDISKKYEELGDIHRGKVRPEIVYTLRSSLASTCRHVF